MPWGRDGTRKGRVSGLREDDSVGTKGVRSGTCITRCDVCQIYIDTQGAGPGHGCLEGDKPAVVLPGIQPGAYFVLGGLTGHVM
jgi:hypothetical protein